MIPPILTLHYELIQELNTARDLLDALNAAGIKGAEEQFLSEKIHELETNLDDSAGEVQRLIDQLGDNKARIFASLHFQGGYQWAEIAGIFGLMEPATKASVYRALHSTNL